MEVVRDKDGAIIQRSANLAGIRRYVRSNIIKSLDITRLSKGEGQLSILFENGSSFQTCFPDFGQLKSFVHNWRNVYGAPLRVNGVKCGLVARDSAFLI